MTGAPRTWRRPWQGAAPPGGQISRTYLLLATVALAFSLPACSGGDATPATLAADGGDREPRPGSPDQTPDGAADDAEAMIPVTSTDVGTARDGPAETNEPLGADGALASDAGNDTAPVDAGAPPCFDDMQDGDESDVDCGGSVCSPCLPFWRCRGPSDCLGNSCDPDSLLCRPSCTDGFRDGDESDVDCGGSCPKCALYKDCSLASDCRTGICAFWDHGDHCLPPDTCHDGARDGGETDVDCGGPYCIWCFSGQGCVLDADCSRKACVAGRCS